jgi:hypothetical protein
LSYLISPILETAFEIQQNTSDINLKSNTSSKNGCWQTTICINAQTSKFHNENDCNYTIITIPRQAYFNHGNENNEYHFIFKLTNHDKVHLKLHPGMSFIFSGLFLTHRQSKVQKENKSDSVLFNIVSYENK